MTREFIGRLRIRPVSIRICDWNSVCHVSSEGGSILDD